MGKLGFGAIGALVVFGGVFIVGLLVGGSWSTNSAEASYQQRLGQVQLCFDNEKEADTLRPCIVEALQ